MTPASSASPPSAFNLLSLVSPSLTRSPGHEAMETERAALDKVVAHLNVRRARPETRGFAALERFGGAAGANADEATARRIAFFCFKFWQQLAATSATPGRASTPGTPRSFSPRPHPTSSRSTWTSGSSPKPGGGDALDGGGSRVAVAAAPAGAVAAVGTERGGGDGFAGDDRPSDAASGALGEAVSPGTRDATDARDTRGATEG